MRVIAVVVPSSETVPELDSSIPRRPPPHSVSPEMVVSVNALVVVLRWKVPTAGSVAVLVVRHVIPNVSLILHAAPITWIMIDLISGRAPSKPEYRTCQGRVSVRMVAVPFLQAPTVALVIKPIRVPICFIIVLECSEPSSVR